MLFKMQVIGKHKHNKGKNACVANSVKALGFGHFIPKGFEEDKRLMAELAAVLPDGVGLHCVAKMPSGVLPEIADTIFLINEDERELAIIDVPILIECMVGSEHHCTAVELTKGQELKHYCTYTGQIQLLKSFTQFPYLLTGIWVFLDLKTRTLIYKT